MSKLLIVDDDSVDLLEMMKNILQRKGHTVNILVSADDIYREIYEFQPDLLILDIYLAGKDGREICRQLKRNSGTEHLGVLAFSASPKELVDYKSYYADDFMEKPFNITVLLEKINTLLHSTA